MRKHLGSSLGYTRVKSHMTAYQVTAAALVDAAATAWRSGPKMHIFFSLNLFTTPQVLNTYLIRTDVFSFNSFIQYDFSRFFSMLFFFKFISKSEKKRDFP